MYIYLFFTAEQNDNLKYVLRSIKEEKLLIYVPS